MPQIIPLTEPSVECVFGLKAGLKGKTNLFVFFTPPLFFSKVGQSFLQKACGLDAFLDDSAVNKLKKALKNLLHKIIGGSACSMSC